MKKSSYSVIGAMAGSSMDGLDLAQVLFTLSDNEWSYIINHCETIPYDAKLYDLLSEASEETEMKQKKLDVEFGDWIANKILSTKTDEPVDLLAVHGHTVTHQPEKGVSWQLGSGEVIAKKCNIVTVADFRAKDITLGGQGAPLVPFGDFNLFSEYDSCLNLGGIANISRLSDETAWDVCPCNQVLNFFARKLGYDFDAGGKLATRGTFDEGFYKDISSMDFFSEKPPKSLPNHYIGTQLLETIRPENGLYTYCHFIADQIFKSVDANTSGKLLITGGGGFNVFLIELIKDKLKNWEVTVPNRQIVNFKEALVFGFLGVMRVRNEVNVLKSVTGAAKDSSSGVIHLP